MHKTLIIPITAALISCGGDGNPEIRFEQAFYQNQVEWQTADERSYTFEYSERGFSPLQGSWQIRVEDGVVTEVSSLGDAVPTPSRNLSTETAPAIEDLYANIASCFASVDCNVTELEYHTDSFVPAYYYAQNATEGWGFEVRNFEAL